MLGTNSDVNGGALILEVVLYLPPERLLLGGLTSPVTRRRASQRDLLTFERRYHVVG